VLDDRETFQVKPGDTIYVPTGVFRSTRNTGWEPMRLLALYSPGGPEKVLEGLPDFQQLAPAPCPVGRGASAPMGVAVENIELIAGHDGITPERAGGWAGG
jgi:hypothetical protein